MRSVAVCASRRVAGFRRAWLALCVSVRLFEGRAQRTSVHVPRICVLFPSGVAFRRSAGGARLGKSAKTGPTSHGCRSCSRLTLDRFMAVSWRFHDGFVMITP